MQYFLLQTGLLMLAAFLLGALVACMARRLFAGSREEAAEPSSLQAQPAVVVTPAHAVAPAPAAPVQMQQPAAPRIEPSARPAAPPPAPLGIPPAPAPEASSTRFDRALGVPAQPVAPAVAPAPTPAPAPAAPAASSAPSAPKPAASASAPVAPAAPVAPSAAKPVSPPAAPPPAASAPAAVAAAAAAAAAAASAVAKPVAAPAPAAAAPRVVLPAAASSGGPAVASAPIGAPAPAVAAPVAPSSAAKAAAEDDLTRIRGIDAATSKLLASAGVRKFAEIAGWMRPQIDGIAKKLGVAGRVEKENWIEQAQVLSKGGVTDYARRLALGGIPLAKPSAVAPELKAATPASPPAPVVARPVVPPPAPVAPTSPAAVVAPGSTEDLTRIRGIDATVQRRLNEAGVRSFADIAKWTASDVSRINTLLGAVKRVEQQNWIEQAQVLSKGGVTDYARGLALGAVPPSEPSGAAPVAKAPAPAPAPVAAKPVAPPPPPVARPAPPPAVAAGSIDDLTRIRGIDATVQRRLSEAGIRSFADIAKWTSSDVSRINTLLGAVKRVEQQNWIEQAQVLSKGGETDYSRSLSSSTASPAPAPQRPASTAGTYTSLGVAKPATAASTEPVAARPAKLADAIRSNTVDAPKPAAPRTDLAGLRSVRSEALRGSEAGDAGRGLAGSRPGSIDDLKRIRGIGVLIEKKLNSLGVTSYEQIAHWSSNDIERVSNVLDFKGRIERENWVEQARILASGGQTEFSRRVDRGEVESMRSKS